MTLIIENSRLIPIMAHHFANLCWLIKAAAKADDIRKNLAQKIFSEDGILITTDGHRLHMYQQETDDLPDQAVVPDGLWEIKSKTTKMIVLEKVEDESFPSIWRIFRDSPERIGIFNAYGASDKDKYGSSFGEFLLHVHAKTGMAFNVHYIADAFMPEHSISIEKHGNNMLVIGNDVLIAAVMALRIGSNNGSNQAWREAA